jgi:hypothetical protein
MIAANTADTGENLIKRVNLGNSLLFLMRGSPTVYYGDELGIKGGRDAEARQDIMPTEVEDWQTASRIGSDPIGTNSGLDSALLSNPVAAHITALQTLRANNPALVNGAFIVRQSTGKIASFSRFKAGEKTEYVVAVNGSDTDGSITVNTSSPSTSFTGIFGNSDNVTASASGQLTITVPARTAVVYKADALLPALSAAPSVTVKATKNELMVTPLLTASLTSKDPVTVTFVARTSTTGKWFRLGSDDNPTYQLPLMPESWHGKKSIQVAAIVKTSNGKISSSPIITVVRSVVTPS